MKNYLKPDRLADVIAAITTMANYKLYKLNFADWADRISGRKEDANHWEQVLREHPEFFRVAATDKEASLVWRRQYPRNFDVHAEVEVPPDQLSGQPRDRYSRKPLGAGETTALIGIAISLHDRALEQQKAGRWWIPIVTAVLAFVGGLLGAAVANS